MYKMTYNLNGRAKGLFQLTDVEGNVLLLERIDLADGQRRSELVPRVRSYTQLPPAEIEQALKQLASEAIQQAEERRKSEPVPAPEAEEIDVAQMIRPERFITPEVSGLSVPTAVRLKERIAKTWRVYLRWRDGRRERREMFSTLELPDGTRLWVYPDPGEPPAEMTSGWSKEARRRWMEGEPASSPWEAFGKVCQFIAYYLDFRPEEAPAHTAALAAFTILTYCSPAFPAVPYLFFSGTAGSGKSRALEVLQEITFRPYFSADPSPALVFRTLHSAGGTLLLDEAERLKQGRDPSVQELLCLLQAGYRRSGSASRLEPVGDQFRPTSFQVFGPKALASISGPPAALASRCIMVPMIRAGANSPKPKRRIASERAQPIRDMLHALALEYGETFLELSNRDVCPAEVFGRNWEIWHPILAIASWVEEHGGDGILRLLQEHAIRAVEQSRDETIPAHDEILLQVLTERLLQGACPTPKEVLETATAREPNLFERWSAEAASNHLKRYGITTRKSCGRRVYDPTLLKELLRVQKTYGIDLGLLQNADTTPGELTLTDPIFPQKSGGKRRKTPLWGIFEGR